MGIFTGAKIAIVLAILVALGGAYWKYTSLVDDLDKSNAALSVEKTNNETLRNNITVITETNKANQLVIDQQNKAAKASADSIVALSTSLKKSTSSFKDLGAKIDTMTVAPVPLTPYFKEAIDGIQERRDMLAAPVPAPSASEPQ